ncbi:Krueppel factor 1 [Fasciola hepatica]|uniref:Krueppel factor 1 n=1 Tax=Fasciola hepatica TaxID=6192 RepID=A0A2H1BUN9_FASHE|nr:Krueppel factor 1 [Fasciola hepatica]
MLTDAPSALSIRKFVCPYSGCEKSYMKRSYLRAHMCIHTGEKPYVCTYPCDSGGASSDSTPSICGERFGRSDELTRHRRRHEDLRPFVCSVCSRAFRRADHRRVHLRRHERDSLLKTRFAASTESPSENTSTDTPIVSDQRHPIKSNEEEDLPDVKQPVPNGKEFSQSTSSRPSTPSQTTTTSTAIPPLSCVLLTGTFVCLLPTDLLTNLIMSSVSAQLAQTVSNSPSPTTSHSTPTNHVDS